MRHAAVLIGNSSAGLLEAPSLGLGVVNVGPRQRGRLAADNVVFVDADADAVASALERVLGDDFQRKLKTLESPFGDGQSVPRIVRELGALDLAALQRKTEDPLDA